MQWMSVRGWRYGCWTAACIILVTLGLSAAGSPQAAAKEAAKESASPNVYRIGAGDILQILVWREPEASLPETVVQADGKISVPLIGEVQAAGLTIEELQKSLVEKMERYIHNAVVTVDAKQINSRKVYVMGAVKKEGPILLLRPMTVLQAINEAGGFTEFAKKKKVYILRTVDGKQVKLPFDYSAVLKGKNLEQNITLMVDDTIVVP
jgi:polysaccharide export outer membrane protein